MSSEHFLMSGPTPVWDEYWPNSGEEKDSQSVLLEVPVSPMSLSSYPLYPQLFAHILPHLAVSRGFGIDREPGYTPNTPTNLNRIVFDRLNSLFPAPNGVKVGESGRKENMNSYISGAVGGVG